jgi:hypothetical protein
VEPKADPNKPDPNLLQWWTHASIRDHVGKIHPGEDIASRRARESLRHQLITERTGAGVKAKKERRRLLMQQADAAREAEGKAPDHIPALFGRRTRRKDG